MYDIRDLLGHFVKPRSAEASMCPHRCCRGRRPHPDNFPLLLDRAQLRGASEAQLLRHLGRYGGRHPKVAKQTIGEIDRRERAEVRKARARDRRTAADAEWHAHLANEWEKAEAETNGYMVNKAGDRAGVDPRSLFTGPEARARKYASEELRRYWEHHPRLSRAEFLGGEAAQHRGARRRSESRLYGVY